MLDINIYSTVKVKRYLGPLKKHIKIIFFPDKECGDLENPLFGFVQFNSKRIGAEARYKCQQVSTRVG